MGTAKTTAKKKPRKKVKKNKLTAALFIVSTFYVALMLLYVGIFVLILTHTQPSGQAMKLTVVYEGGKKSNYSEDEVYFNDSLYVPYKELDKVCDFIITGDSKHITLITGNSDDYCTLYTNSMFLYVGNVPFRLTAPVIFGDSDYYIPIEVIENYMFGVNVVTDEKKNTVTLSCDDPSAISFIGKYQNAPEKIKETDIPVN